MVPPHEQESVLRKQDFRATTLSNRQLAQAHTDLLQIGRRYGDLHTGHWPVWVLRRLDEIRAEAKFRGEQLLLF